jgi:hypothetical protein
MGVFKKKKVVIDETIEIHNDSKDADKDADKKGAMDYVTPKEIGKLDMVIAFDTTGSMAAYIDAVRKEIADLIPRLFKDNGDLRLGMVAFGDYCDMPSAGKFGKAYQCVMPTDNENALIKFVKNAADTCGGDGDEFYELVLDKIVNETPWREDSTRSILLISDANPHPLGYTYRDRVVGNQIDWRKVAEQAASMNIKIDTVTITDASWYRELSAMTNGVSVPFRSGYKTARLVEASVMSKGSAEARRKWDMMYDACDDFEMREVYRCYEKYRKESK